EVLPRGPGAALLRRVGAEIEMWLHEHPLNEARRRAQRLPVSALWLWGGGAPLEAMEPARALPSQVRSSARGCADDPYLLGLARLCGVHTLAPVSGFESLAAEHGVLARVDLPRLASGAISAQALEDFDRCWIAPAARALARGRLARLTLLTGRR